MVLPHGAVTQGRQGQALAPMGEMGTCRAGVKGFSDDGSPVADSEIMRRAMEYARTFDALIISHSEEPSLSAGGQMNEGYYSTFLGLRGIPPESERIGVFRDICLAEKTGVRLHLAHLSTAGSVELVRDAKKRGLPVTCEVAPHHFSLDDSGLTGYDTNLKMNPPLRLKSDVEALLEALSDGTIDVIATDHAPHASHEKETEFDHAEFGCVGMETALGLVITRLVGEGVLSMEDGTTYEGIAFGADGEFFGEVCFNTSMAGYQEILTDPSYAGQMVNMTYCLIGNYGVNPQDFESDRIYMGGFIVRESSRMQSNWRASGDLDGFLASNGIVGLEGIDTRALTRHIRIKGAICLLYTSPSPRD